MNLRNVISFIAIISMATLSACGVGNCLPDNNGDGLTLKIEAPAQYPAGLSESISAVLTITNTSSVDANNLTYTVPSPGEAGNYTGVIITPNAGMDSVSGDCSNIPAETSCTFIVTIGAYANPGSFTVTATPNLSPNLIKQMLNIVLSNSFSVATNLSMVGMPEFTTPYYLLPGNQTVLSSDDKSTIVYVSLLVKDAGSGLSRIDLVDENGISLDYELVGDELFTDNAVNTYKVIVPAGKIVQNIQAKSNICSVDCSNNALVNLAGNEVGILSIEPDYFVMTGNYTNQIITIQNTGNGLISNLAIPTLSAPFSIQDNNCGNTLAPNAICTLKVVYTPSSESGESAFVVSYNNGRQTRNSSAIIPYVGVSSLMMTIDNTPIAGEQYCAVVTITTPEVVNIDTVIALSISNESVSGYGFAQSAPFPSTTTCTILAGESSCSTETVNTILNRVDEPQGSNNLCAAINQVGNPIYLTATTSSYLPATLDTRVGGAIFFKVKEGDRSVSPMILNKGFTGDLKSQAESASGTTMANGVAGADYICNYVGVPSPASGTFYKALISVSGIRNIGTGGESNLDWVLKPNTRYVRAQDGVTIATTNESAIFDFPLESGIVGVPPQVITAPQGFAWTGMNADWTPYTENNCNGYTSSASNLGLTSQGIVYMNSGSYFNTAFISSWVLYSENGALRYCNVAQGSSNVSGLICVQQ